MNVPNNVKLLREKKLMSKSELARKAGVSTVTIDRIERGGNPPRRQDDPA